MRKFIVVIALGLCAFGAYAAGEEQIATSQAYVTEELATKQDRFNKLGTNTAMTYSGSTDGAVGTRTISGNLGAETNTNDTSIPTVDAVNTKLANQQDTLNMPAGTVLTNTGVAGEPGTKGIYDDSGSYVTQQDALIDADTFNAAVQNAVNSEFVCVEWKDPNDHTSPCYLFEIATPVAPSRNLFDISKVTNTFNGGSGITNNGDGTLTVTSSKGSSANYSRKLSKLAPGIVVGNTYTLSFNTTSNIKVITLEWYDEQNNVHHTNLSSGEHIQITQSLYDATVGFQSGTGTTSIISNIQLEEGTAATPYQPYGQNTYLPQNVQ